MSKKPPDKGMDLGALFGKNVPRDEMFAYDQFKELHSLLSLTVQVRSMALVTGQAGVGKTTGVRSFADELPTNKFQIIYAGQDHDGGNLSRRLASSLGIQPKHFRSHTWLAISQHLSDNLIEQGKEVILVMDEAHLLDDRTLEEIRLLTNSDFDRNSPITVIMVGQLSLRSRLKQTGFEALNQRLRFRYALEGFSEEETAEYIKIRLRSASLNEDFFATDAIKSIFLAAQGIPREINNICTAVLLKARSQNTDKADAKIVRQVLDQREIN